MRLDAGCEIIYEVTDPTPLILILQPRSGDGQQVIEESCTFAPRVSSFEYVDVYGNRCRRLEAPSGSFTIRANAIVETSPTIDIRPGALQTPVLELPEYVIQFLLPSRYCQSDLLIEPAQNIVGNVTPGYDQVEAIRFWIQANVQYEYGTSNTSTSAQDTFTHQRGVCRDFAHLGIALCRSLDIPARMVAGYLYQLDPMDLHAWFEAFIAGRWYTFDATQKQPRGGRIVIAYGRDAADIALATQFGPATLNEMRVWVNE